MIDECTDEVCPERLGGPHTLLYCGERRCAWRPTDERDPRCSKRRYQDSEFCLAHQELWVNEGLGLGPEAPTVTHANGAKESHVPYAFTSVDPLALLRMAQIQQQGDRKYGPDNWRRIDSESHINHALAHLFAYLAGDESDDHLGHAAVRITFALATTLRPDFHGKDARDDG